MLIFNISLYFYIKIQSCFLLGFAYLFAKCLLSAVTSVCHVIDLVALTCWPGSPSWVWPSPRPCSGPVDCRTRIAPAWRDPGSSPHFHLYWPPGACWTDQSLFSLHNYVKSSHFNIENLWLWLWNRSLMHCAVLWKASVMTCCNVQHLNEDN